MLRSTDVNKRGESLFNYIWNNNLFTLNKGTKPTFINAIRQQVIDSTIASKGIAGEIRDWKVSDETTFSDHLWICFEVCNVV